VAGRRLNPYRHIERPAVPLLLTVQEAAETLRTTPEGLRARLRRAQIAGSDGTVTAPLGPGIVGIKVGSNSWRVRFDAA
jgi:membrane protein implicated in regulation of membrane protease activity